jgi:hypothetical protein
MTNRMTNPMTSETHDSDKTEAPETQQRTTLPSHKLTIALVGLAVGSIILVALNMN